MELQRRPEGHSSSLSPIDHEAVLIARFTWRHRRDQDWILGSPLLTGLPTDLDEEHWSRRLRDATIALVVGALEATAL